MRAPDPLLDRRELERLERLALRWQRAFSGILGGNNVSRYPGVGHEFLDHRHFQQGDDLRSVNWRAYLRLERLFLKMFRTEPRTPVRILLDTSESMACGASATANAEPKFAYACRLAAALCYVGLVRLETIVLQPFADRLAESYRAQGGRHRFAGAGRFLSSLETGRSSNFFRTIREFANRVAAPGLLVIVSDFLDDADCAGALQRAADLGHELFLVQVAGPEDASPPWGGELEVVDAETGAATLVVMDRERSLDYQRAFDEYSRKIEYTALRNSGRYLRLVTDVPLNDVLFGPLGSNPAVVLH